jgi:hypothetical protein
MKAVKAQSKSEPLQSIGEIQTTDLRNSTIAIALQQIRYLTTEGVVIDQNAADV